MQTDLGVPEGSPADQNFKPAVDELASWDGRLPTSVTLDVPHDVAQQLSVPGGLDARHLRLTLADLGDLDGEGRAKVHEIASRVAGEHWPTPVQFTSMERQRQFAKEDNPFYASEALNDTVAAEGNEPDYDSVYAVASHPALQAMYKRMADELRDAELPSQTDYTTPPKVNLGRVALGRSPLGGQKMPGWTAKSLNVHEGPANTEYPLTGSPKRADASLESDEAAPVAKGETWIAKEDSEQRLVYMVVLTPNLRDQQGDRMSKEEIEATAHDYMREAQLLGIGPHSPEQRGTPRPDIELMESYIAPQDLRLNGKLVREGSWVTVARTPPDVWEEVKRGEKTGVSLWGVGERVGD
jgi:hypothetical protein